MARYDGDRVISTYDPQRTSVEMAVYLGRVRLSCEGITISEVILEGHAMDLTALFRAASKLFLDVQFTSGPRITEPVVKIFGDDMAQASYCVPEGWDLADALQLLPSAFTAARPKVAHALKYIEEEKKTSSETLSRFLDEVILMILKAGDPDGVFAEMERVLQLVEVQEAVVPAPV